MKFTLSSILLIVKYSVQIYSKLNFLPFIIEIRIVKIKFNFKIKINVTININCN